jgi:NAD kinase
MEAEIEVLNSKQNERNKQMETLIATIRANGEWNQNADGLLSEVKAKRKEITDKLEQLKELKKLAGGDGTVRRRLQTFASPFEKTAAEVRAAKTA